MFREGAAMLRAAVADFAALDGHQIITTRDARLEGELPAGQVRTVQSGHFDEALDACLAACDAALVVAPETGDLLAGLTERVEAAGLLNLGSGSVAVRMAADKLATVERLAAAGLPVPPTREVKTPEEAARAGFPLVLKPRDGAGCTGLRVVKEAAGLEEAWREAAAESVGSALIAEPCIPGRHASVSLVSDGKRTVALSLNAQTIAEGKRFEYRGGVLPLDHPLRERALEVAARACHSVPGLRGYVGVDLVLGAEATVIEINPRLTTAYVGLRRALGENLAGVLLAAARGELPGEMRCVTRARFSAGGRVKVEPLLEVPA
jgi:tyramine---L-glutamate ligase